MNVVDIINEAISERRTRFAFELLPPLKGDGCCGVFGSIDRLIGFDPAYINVTFHREGIKQAVRPALRMQQGERSGQISGRKWANRCGDCHGRAAQWRETSRSVTNSSALVG